MLVKLASRFTQELRKKMISVSEGSLRQESAKMGKALGQTGKTGLTSSPYYAALSKLESNPEWSKALSVQGASRMKRGMSADRLLLNNQRRDLLASSIAARSEVQGNKELLHKAWAARDLNDQARGKLLSQLQSNRPKSFTSAWKLPDNNQASHMGLTGKNTMEKLPPVVRTMQYGNPIV